MEPMTLSNLLTHPGLSGWKARTAKVETGGYRSRLGETCTMGAPLGREKAAATEVDTIFDFLKRWNQRGFCCCINVLQDNLFTWPHSSMIDLPS